MFLLCENHDLVLTGVLFVESEYMNFVESLLVCSRGEGETCASSHVETSFWPALTVSHNRKSTDWSLPLCYRIDKPESSLFRAPEAGDPPHLQYHHFPPWLGVLSLETKDGWPSLNPSRSRIQQLRASILEGLQPKQSVSHSLDELMTRIVEEQPLSGAPIKRVGQDQTNKEKTTWWPIMNPHLKPIF